MDGISTKHGFCANQWEYITVFVNNGYLTCYNVQFLYYEVYR